MRATRSISLPFLAALACGPDEPHDEPSDETIGDVEQCNPTGETFTGLDNADAFWHVNSHCDEIFVCADAAAAHMLNELLGLECQVQTGPYGCNGDGEMKCTLATEVITTEQHVADACTALSVPDISEVFCLEF